MLRIGILIFFLALCFPQPIFAASKNLSVPFSYYAKDESLIQVLTQFARIQGYNSFFSESVKGKISGRFDNMKGKEFLNAMQAAFGISWYRLDNTLYFYDSKENKKAFITPHAMSAERLFSMLSNSRVFSQDLLPQMASDGSMIIVNGPQGYIDQIEKAASVFEQNQTSNFVMEVFPLQHAWADDKQITSLDQDITIPGIASILRSMVLGGSPSTGTSSQQNSSSVPKMEGLNGHGLSGRGSEQAASSSSTPSGAAPSSAVNIMADARVNAVIVNDMAYRMPYYKKVIADLDKPVELVEIHAAIVDVDSNFNRELGFTFQGVGQVNDNVVMGGNASGGPGVFTPLPTIGEVTSGGLGLSTIYSYGSDYFLARIQALQADGNARVLGRPSVLTIDNIQASLENTSTYYIRVEGNEAVDLFKVEAGTVLRVTPHIIHNDDGTKSIKLAVNVHDNQNNDQDTTIIGAIPPIRQTKINTQAIVGEGQSLLIGGYYYEQSIDEETGIPFFKDIPIMGHLFKTTTTGARQMERLILITPRIISVDSLENNVPAHVDNQNFHRSPTQAHYEERIPPAELNSGCAKKTTKPSDPAEPAKSDSEPVKSEHTFGVGE